jgi:hypothetical protein
MNNKKTAGGGHVFFLLIAVCFTGLAVTEFHPSH